MERLPVCLYVRVHLTSQTMQYLFYQENQPDESKSFQKKTAWDMLRMVRCCYFIVRCGHRANLSLHDPAGDPVAQIL